MPAERIVTEAEKEQIRREVEAEFPGDPMMQELHYIRQLRYSELQEFSPAERARQYVKTTEPTAAAQPV